MKAQCMKCGEQKEMKNAKIDRTKRGGYMAKGNCVDCDTKMCKIMKKEDAEEMMKQDKKAA